jgi:hypothetical protein
VSRLLTRTIVDLRAFLRDKDDDGNVFKTDKERDKDLWAAFLEAGIFIAAGGSCHNEGPIFTLMLWCQVMHTAAQFPAISGSHSVLEETIWK